MFETTFSDRITFLVITILLSEFTVRYTDIEGPNAPSFARMLSVCVIFPFFGWDTLFANASAKFVFIYISATLIYIIVLNNIDEKATNQEEEKAKAQTNNRKTLPSDVRKQVWERDEGKCTKCGSSEDIELDHIIPLAKGGSNNKNNIQLLCAPCNRSKGSKVQ